MPTKLHTPFYGRPYYQWGNTGKKYYFSTEKGKIIAFNKANKQGQAIKAHEYGIVK